MAKRKVTKDRIRLSVRDLIAKKEYPIIETSNGVELEVLGVSILRLEEIKSLYDAVKPPTYEQNPDTLAEGDTPEVYTLDEAVIEEEADAGRKAEMQAQWNDYLVRQAKQTEQLTMQTFDLLFGEGLRIPRVGGVIPEETQAIIDKWTQRRRQSGADIPEDEDELHKQFVRLHLLATNEDIMYASMMVREQSGDSVSQEDMERATKSFRSNR